MSLYLPAAISGNDLNIVEAPYFGGEWAVFASHTPAQLIAEILLHAPDDTSPDFTLVRQPSPASHLQIVATSYLRSSAPTELDFNSTPGSAAQFSPPSRAADQSNNFQRGYALDIDGGVISAINGIIGVTGGDANVSFAIYQLPSLASYFQIGCTTDKNFNLKGRVAKGVDCGMETDAFIKRGKTKPAMLTISQKLKTFADGLARLDGGKVTVMLQGIKDGQVTQERIVFTEWIPTNAVKLPDGEGEAMMDSEEGKYGEALIFVAA